MFTQNLGYYHNLSQSGLFGLFMTSNWFFCRTLSGYCRGSEQLFSPGSNTVVSARSSQPFGKRRFYPRIKAPGQNALALIISAIHFTFIRRMSRYQRCCPILIALAQFERCLQNPQQISIRIQALFLCSLDQAVDYAVGLRGYCLAPAVRLPGISPGVAIAL